MIKERLTLGIIFCAIALVWLGSLAPAQDGKNPLTNADFQQIARKYLEAWGVEPGAPFIWVVLAMPNASVPLNTPGITFGPEGMSVASMTREVRGYMIVVNGKMAPEIALSSFLRELGRATYMRSNPNGTEEVAAETASILFLLGKHPVRTALRS